MKNCPKCNTPNPLTAENCSNCGASFEEVGGGTINFNASASLSPGEIEESRSSSSIVGAQNATESPEHLDERTDSSPTVRVSESSSSSSDETSTVHLSEGAEAKSATSSGGTPTTGKLEKIWDAAIGSSGKDSKRSLRHQAGEAADSIFQRIAERSVVFATSDEAKNSDYQIKDKMGEGGMGLVYSALQTAVNRVVALKVAKPEKTANTATRRQFFYEAAITADLDHPNIPAIYELGVYGGDQLFYSMKLITGSGWETTIRKKTLSENLEIFGRVADAVGFAHSKNVIHRDLKPENVMVGGYGEVYVTDWGLAADISQRAKIAFGGTPDYMAPEMANNKQSQIGKHSDVYLLGAILFQILTGRPPHFARTQRERLALASENIILDVESQDPLMVVARKAMNTIPEDRYGSIEEMQAAIREILQHNDSIELANRSSELLQNAVRTKNYDTFNRAIFGFRDAIDLWGDNKVAQNGLQEARIAYGQCALDQGNFDLALQTLDEKNTKESALYSQAKKAKRAAESREIRFKRFRRVAMSGLAVLVCCLTGALVWAYRSNQKVQLAQDNLIKETNLKLEEETAKNAALEIAAAEKLRSEELKNKARQDEEKRRIEKEQDDEALRKKDESLKEQERKAKDEAFLKDVEAKQKEADLKAEGARRLADQQKVATDEIKLTGLTRDLNLANSLVRQLDAQNSSRLLADILNTKLDNLPDSKAPSFANWPLRRVQLLANTDLSKQPLGARVTALDFAPAKNFGVAGNESGELVLLQFKSGALSIDERAGRKSLGSRIVAVVMSPDAKRAIIAVESKPTNAEAGASLHELYEWTLPTESDSNVSEPTKIAETQKRSFQGLQYSPDGITALAGINQGLWARKEQDKWKKVSTSTRSTVRGKLVAMTWVSATRALVLSELDKVKTLHLADVATNTIERLDDVPVNMTNGMTAMAIVTDGRLLVGNDSGQLFVHEVAGNQISVGEELKPRRHDSPVAEIRVAGGRVATRSDEPVVQVWSVAVNGSVEHETTLTGAPSAQSVDNIIANVAFIDKDNIVLVDTTGNAVSMSIDRQKQRSQIVRRSATGVESYPAPVIGIHAMGKTQNAIAVDSNGVIDLWNLQTGVTVSSGERFAYIGHTPGASVVDSQVDVEMGVVITAANLRNAVRGYLVNPEHVHEYCFWDLKSGNMLKRWTETGNGFVNPRMTIMKPGRLLSFTDKSEVLDYSGLLAGQDLSIVASDFLKKAKPAFAAANPQDSSLIAMMNLQGRLILLPESQLLQGELTNTGVSMGVLGELPLKASWSPDGERLYVVFNNGKLFRANLSETGFANVKQIGNVMGESSVAITSHHAVDLLVESDGADDRVYCVSREFGKAMLFECTVGTDGDIKQKSTTTDPRLAWLDGRGLKSIERIGGKKINVRQLDNIVTAKRVGEQYFVTTKREGVYYSSNESSARLIGQGEFKASSADRDGKYVWLLREDGTVDRYDTATRQWSRMPYNFENAKGIGMSPDGTQLAIHFDSFLRIVDPNNGTVVTEYKDIAHFTWDPQADANLGMIGGMGDLFVSSQKGPLRSIKLEGDRVVSLHFFDERWQNQELETTRYLLVQTEKLLAGESNEGQSSEAGRLVFVPLNEDGKVFESSLSTRGEIKLAVSPKESILATGDSIGAIRIWFASPTYEKLDGLFGEPSERDAPIRGIAFADDGDTLITSDGKNRLRGLLSKDKLNAAQ
jgi:serine/threonine protein kinase